MLKVGVAHLGEFGSVERIAQAKSEIVRGEAPNAITVLNADDERVAAMSGIAKGDVFWFGIDKAQAHDIDGYMAADDIALDDLGHPCSNSCPRREWSSVCRSASAAATT